LNANRVFKYIEQISRGSFLVRRSYWGQGCWVIVVHMSKFKLIVT